MSEIVRLQTNARNSKAVIHGGVVYLSGQTPDDRDQDIGDQTSQVLSKIDQLLLDAGTDRSRLLAAQVWLKDIARDFGGMNKVWEAWTAPNAAPARATAQAELAHPAILVEIIVSAALPE